MDFLCAMGKKGMNYHSFSIDHQGLGWVFIILKEVYCQIKFAQAPIKDGHFDIH